jgi:excisionase family DNA binding protein
MRTAIAFTIPEACDASGLGRTSIYALISSGRLRARKHGKRTLILRKDLLAFLEGLPDLTPPQARPPTKRRRSSSAAE